MDLLYKNQKYLNVLLGDIGILFITLFVHRFLENSQLILYIGPVLILVNTLQLWFSKELKKSLDFIIRYRYPIALFVFLVLVFFRVNGSSIGVFDTIYGKEENIITEQIGRAHV